VFSYFTFNNSIHKQTMSISSPLFSIIANLILCDLEARALKSFDIPLLFYLQYIDIATAIPRDKTQEILNIFNLFHSRLQFTIQVERNELNFFYLKIIKKQHNRVWLISKSNFLGRYLNFHSQHFLFQKERYKDRHDEQIFFLFIIHVIIKRT